ncbi:MAG: trigger factor [bacterium]
MESKITQEGNNKKVVEVSLTEAELIPYFDAAYRKYQKGLRLEGFRKGKVPMALVKKLYREAIQNEVIDEVVQKVFREVAEKENIHLVAPATLKDVDYQPEQGLHFKAVVEVMPEIELQNYQGLAVEREIYQVDELDVEAALADVREQMAVMNPVEDAAREEDYLLADLQEVDAAGLPIVGKKFENQFFQLGKNGVNQELSQQLLGIKPGETRRITIASQQNDDPEEKKIEHFEVSVKEIKSKQLPELDDELAKDAGEFETLEELKNDLKNRLEKQAQHDARRQLKHRLIDEILKKNPFDLPEVVIDNYLDALLENAKRNAREEFDEEMLRQRYRPDAVWNLKWEYVKDKLVEKENLTLSEEDKNLYIARLAEERGVPADKIRQSLKNPNTRKRFESDFLEMKVLDFLESHAKIKEVKLTRKDLEKTRKLVMP